VNRLVNFSDDDIKYLKSEAIKLYEYLQSKDKKIIDMLDYLDAEDKEIIELFATKQLWDDVNSNKRINELIIIFCEGALGMACWIIRNMYSEDVEEFMGKDYANVYATIYGDL
jgi:hypothetical protein